MSHTKHDAAAIIANASRHKTPPATSDHRNHPAKQMWCETQWSNLSMQAKKLELPELPYFDPETMLLSKEVNVKLWDQLVSGYYLVTISLAPPRFPVFFPPFLQSL